MTILIGVLCQDGIVVGTDSSATFSTCRTPTIEQKCRKIEIIDGHVIVAGTGAVGLCQRFTAIVEEHWTAKKFREKTPIQISKELCALGITDFQSTAAPKDFGALVAFSANGKFSLCEFAVKDFQPELKTENLWYVAMGSGQNIADPFLGLMRHVFWKDTPPRLSGGIFSVLWALNHTIELNPGGINGPSQIAILLKTKDGFQARMLDSAELSEHEDNVRGAEEHLEKYKNVLEGKSNNEIPKPPI